MTTVKRPCASVCVALCNTTTSLRTTLHPAWATKGNKSAPQWDRVIAVRAKVLPRCVIVLLLVMPPDWFWCRSVSPPSYSLVSVSQVCTCSIAVPVSNSMYVLVRAPLQWHVGSRTLFRGSAFGLRQPFGQSTEHSLALSRRHLDYMPGLTLQ